jgi:hypothetical protein
MLSLWRWTGFKARARAMTKGKQSPIRATKREKIETERPRTKASLRETMTKAVNLEKGSQSKIQGKEKEKVIEFAMFAENLAIWPRIAGAL